MQMNSFKTWNWVILKHAIISSFLMKMTVTTEILYNI